jgi:ankyrin repeat protein
MADDVSGQALWVAAQQGHTSDVERLVSQANHAALSKALHVSARNDHEGATAALLQTYLAGWVCRNYVHSAVTGGSAKALAVLLETCRPCAVDLMSLDPLHVAAKRGHLGVLQVLVAFKAYIDSGDFHGRSALWHAAHKGHVPAVQWLLDSKADVDYNSHVWPTAFFQPLGVAADEGHDAMVSLLLEHRAGMLLVNRDLRTWALVYAADKGHVTTTKLLLDARATVNGTDLCERTPLIHACVHNHVGTARMLVMCKASVNMAGTTGATPLWLACVRGSVKMVRLLLDCKACINSANCKGGGTPLAAAARRDRADVVALLTARLAASTVQDRSP